MVVAADDVGDAHIVIVDHDGEHISRRAVGAKEHEVVEIFVLPDDAALDPVLDDASPVSGAFSRIAGFTPRRSVRGIAVAPASIIEL